MTSSRRPNGRCGCAGSLQVAAGRAEHLFADRAFTGRFDAIVTSFVLDRGPSVSSWLRRIDRALVVGGVWIGAEAFQVKALPDWSFGALTGERLAQAIVDRLVRAWHYELLALRILPRQAYAEGAKAYNLTLVAARKTSSSAERGGLLHSLLDDLPAGPLAPLAHALAVVSLNLLAPSALVLLLVLLVVFCLARRVDRLAGYARRKFPHGWCRHELSQCRCGR
jgi:hypothetical protein